MYKNLKVLIINTYFYNDGGAEIIAFNMYNLFKKHNIETYFWASDKQPYFDSSYEYTQYFTKFNGTIKDYLRNPFEFYYNKKAKQDLQKFIDIIKPDIIHIHSFKTCLTSSILECCKNIPTVVTVHDASLFCPGVTMMRSYNTFCKEQYCKKGRFYNCILHKCSKGKLEPSIRLALKTYIFNKNLKYIDKYITPSQALRQLIIKSEIGINESDIITVNNFLSAKELSLLPQLDCKNYFLFIGRLSKEKGVHYLLEAFKDIPKNIELHIVGTGVKEKELKEYAKINDLSHVKFLGFINHDEIRSEYKDCIATILPCNWFENYPTTTMESFINGKPVIASKIGGLPEQIQDNITGLLFEPGNVEQLKDHIKRYINDKTLAIEHGRNAYDYAKKHFDEERYFSDIMSIYKSLLTNKL